MTAANYTRPNYTTQGGTTYPLNIDAMAKVFERFGDWFAPHENNAGSPAPDMTVRVNAGFTWDGTTFREKPAQQVSGFTAPSAGQHRIDRICINATNGDALRVTGTAATGSPSAVAPAVPAGYIPCAQIYITGTDTAITNDMITDERALITTASSPSASGTPITTNSGTAHTWTGIASGTSELAVSLAGVSTGGSSNLLLQIGDAGGIENSAYSSDAKADGVALANSTAGFILTATFNAGRPVRGIAILKLLDAATFTWACCGVMTDGSDVSYFAGTKSLSAELTQVSLTTVSGDTFDGGTANYHSQR